MSKRPKDRIRDWMFRQVHSKNLVYNTCWEDPRCDRVLLNVTPESELVMITSAGCNALDYLLDKPAAIHCIDVNPRQNALLELKKAVFQNADFDTLFQMFGKGVCRTVKHCYKTKLRSALPNYAQEYWDKNIRYFNGKGVRRTFYHYGTSGRFAWLAERYFKINNVQHKIRKLLDVQTLEEQKHLYLQLEDKVMNSVMEWFVNKHITMSLLGVPRSQMDLFAKKYERGALGFIQECLRKVFIQLPIQDNYFWRLYMSGEYTLDCCPNYLKLENFDTIKSHHNRIHTYTTYISEFLKANPKPYSHYVLLDHQDWLAANNIPALEEEWRLILKNSRSGTKILLRSAAETVNFFPDFVKEQVEFQQEGMAEQHFLDRVGTYASVYLGIVK